MLLARAQGLEEGEAETVVLLKSLQARDEQLQLDFRRECDMFGKLSHPNVARLLGLCREAEPHYMILEYGDLVGASIPASHGAREWIFAFCLLPINTRLLRIHGACTRLPRFRRGT